MSKRTISEKSLEILFNRFLLQSFQLGAVQLFAPTSVEEFRSGYDSKIVGFSSLRELYLQFKAPLYSEARDRFTVTPTDHQHALLKAYPPQTAYYVVPTLRSLAELNSAQRDLASASEFLKHFICIEVSTLPSDVSFFQYTKPATHRESLQIAFKTSQDGAVRIAQHPIASDGCQRGNMLLAKFKTGDVGWIPSLTNEGQKRASTLEHDTHRPDIFTVADGLVATDFGVLLRVPM